LNSGTSSCISIQANNITFDCQGHTIQGNDVATFGIVISRGSSQTTNITIKNCNVSDWISTNIYLNKADGNNLTNISSISSPDHGFWFYYSDSNNITNCTANSNTYDGFRIRNSDSNIISNCTANSNDIGFLFYDSKSNTVSNSTAKENNLYDLYFSVASTTYCNNDIENITGSNDLPIEYYNSSVSLANKELSELVLCNADDSNIENITINASQTKKNNMIFIYYTSDSNFTNITSSENYYGFWFSVSNSNNITNCTANSNDNDGIYLSYSDSNNITNCTANLNDNDGFLVSGSNSNTISNSIANSNNNGFYISSSSNSNTISNSIANSNNNYGFYLISSSNNLLTP